MRHFLFSSCVAALMLAGQARANAQEAAAVASDCGMLCRLRGYLATDHMAAREPGPSTAQSGKAKLHGHPAAALHAPKARQAGAAAPAATLTQAAPKTPAPKPAAATAAVGRAADTALKPQVASPAPTPARIETAVAKPSVRAAAVVRPSLRSSRSAAKVEHSDEVATAETRAPARVTLPAAPRRAVRRPVQTAAVADMSMSSVAPIPGSAPLRAAGFGSLDTPGLR